MPDSSRASRVAAARTDSSPGSKWPPNCSHKPAFACRVSSTLSSERFEHQGAGGEVGWRPLLRQRVRVLGAVRE